MARYILNVAAGGRRASLLVVLSPSQVSSVLHDSVKSRLPALATKLGLTDAKQSQIALNLNAEDGPMLDLEDLLSDVLPDLQRECNCSLARTVDETATLNINGTGDYDALRTAILVHSNNIVVAIPADDIKLSTIERATKAHMEHTLKQNLASKWTNIVSGVKDTTTERSEDSGYLKAPVIAVCSENCHSHRQGQDRDADDLAAQQGLVVGVHTPECPLEITAHNADITIEAAGLEDCAVSGALNIYVVQRWTLGQIERIDQGKASIFKKSEAWKHHV
ncbi:hypothetical protein G6011_01373 [Alternaria panax]|uniref:Uncharacterized protein n=1 Tax=Alternaria panax TaxID=48097 RepID=A0AAD4NVI7_9PLEO|nr:hypothetical protein G6011_01373 [Alternaria panax]